MAARINLLPWRDEERKRKTREFTTQLILCAMLAGLVVMYGIFTVQGQIDHQNRRNQFLQAEIDRLKVELEEIKELESTKEQLLSRMEIIQQLQTRRPQVVHLFHELAFTLPDGVSLTAIAQTQDNITLEGKADSNARVSAFMRNLDESEWLTGPRLEVIEANTDESVSAFKLHLKQTHPKLDKKEK
ncbi:MAG: PilN domain-containing protein [Pseudomonadota bacterium]